MTEHLLVQVKPEKKAILPYYFTFSLLASTEGFMDTKLRRRKIKSRK
jgi:hypothetical protein